MEPRSLSGRPYSSRAPSTTETLCPRLVKIGSGK
jgi:hypothetical protein